MKKTFNVKTFKKPFLGDKNRRFNSVGWGAGLKSFPHLKTYLNKNMTRVEAK